MEPELKDYSQIINQYKQETNFMYNEVFRQSALNFMGQAGDYLKLNGQAFNEDQLIADGIEEKNRTISFVCHTKISKVRKCAYIIHVHTINCIH